MLSFYGSEEKNMHELNKKLTLSTTSNSRNMNHFIFRNFSNPIWYTYATYVSFKLLPQLK